MTRAVLWLVGGVIGTLAVLILTEFFIDTRVPIKPSAAYGISDSGWDQGYISANGTWVHENTQPAFPIQTSAIHCYRDKKMCIDAQAQITWSDTLSVYLDEHAITRWDSQVI